MPKTYNKNTKTTVRAFRITHTQDALLDREQDSSKGRASAIARVLLSLYFNKKINGIEDLIRDELLHASIRESERIEKSKRGLGTNGRIWGVKRSNS